MELVNLTKRKNIVEIGLMYGFWSIFGFQYTS